MRCVMDTKCFISLKWFYDRFGTHKCVLQYVFEFLITVSTIYHICTYTV